jgi:hypothetical protein
MKPIIILAIVCMGCSGWTYNGIKGEDIWADPVSAGAGVLTEIAVHWAGHVAWAQLNGKDWHQEGDREIIDGPLTDAEAAWFGRAGFVASLGVGWAARLMGVDRDDVFWKAYNTASLMEIVTYPIVRGWNDGDLELMGRGGNAPLEWGAYSLLAGALIVEVDSGSTYNNQPRPVMETLEEDYLQLPSRLSFEVPFRTGLIVDRQADHR